MNLNLKAFDDACRNVAKNNLGKTALTVRNEAKTEIGAVPDKPLKLSELKKLPNGDSRIMDNIFMRGQLLTAIRENLMPLNANGLRTGFESKSAQAFFERAETRLFGKLEKNKNTGKMEFGVTTAGADLDALTVTELIDGLNKFVADKQRRVGRLKNALPKMSSVHAKALAMLSQADLIETLGLSSADAAKAKLGGFKLSGGLLKVTVYVSGKRPRAIPAYVDEVGKFHSGQHWDEFERLVNASFATGKGGKYASILPVNDLPEVNKLLKLLVDGKQTKYVKLYAREGKLAQNYESHLRAIFITMIPRALERARKAQPQGAISIQTWWKALHLEDCGNIPDKGGATAVGDALMDALFERTLQDFGKFTQLTKGDFRRLTVDDDEDIDNKVVSRYTSFLMDDTFGYEASIAFRMNPKVAIDPKDMLNMQATLDTLKNFKFGVIDLGRNIHGDHRANGTKFNFGGKELFCVGVSKQNEVIAGLHRLRRQGKFSEKQVGLMIYALNNFEHALPTLLNGVEHQNNVDVDVQAVGSAEAPEMKVTYTIPLLERKGGDTVAVTTKNIVHTVVYSQDGGSRCESFKCEDAPDRTQEKTMSYEAFGQMRIPQIDPEKAKREVSSWMERIETLNSAIRMFTKELQTLKDRGLTNGQAAKSLERQIRKAQQQRADYQMKLDVPKNKSIRQQVLAERLETIRSIKMKNNKPDLSQTLADQEVKVAEELKTLSGEGQKNKKK